MASFSSCAGGFSRYTKLHGTGTLLSDVTYVFEVKLTDRVGNEGQVLTFEWQTGKLCPPSEGVGGHIVFGVDPVDVGVSVGVGGVAFCLHDIS